jgi:pimeloyl-ACP methyl ester carboxylesterase
MIVGERYLAYQEAEISIRTYTHIDQRSSAPTFVFLHDALGCIKSWRDFPESLCRALQYNGVVYDRLGHGKSSSVVKERPLDYLDREAKEILPFIIKELKVEKPILVGCSDGATMALLYGTLNRKCTGIVSIAGHIKVEEITLEGIKKNISKLQSTAYLRRLQDLHGDKAEKLLNDWSRTWLSPAFRNWDVKRALQKITCPTLVIQGREDEYATVQHCREIAEAVGSSCVCVLLDHCGHFPHLEKSKEVLALIQDFLTMRMKD